MTKDMACFMFNILNLILVCSLNNFWNIKKKNYNQTQILTVTNIGELSIKRSTLRSDSASYYINLCDNNKT